MKRITDATYHSLVNLFKERQPDIDASSTALHEIEKNKDSLQYYVTTLGEPSLRDIMGGGVVKTPARYFTNLTKAIIFQDKLILDAYNGEEQPYWLDTYSHEEILGIKSELKYLSEEYPELAI